MPHPSIFISSSNTFRSSLYSPNTPTTWCSILLSSAVAQELCEKTGGGGGGVAHDNLYKFQYVIPVKWMQLYNVYDANNPCTTSRAAQDTCLMRLRWKYTSIPTQKADFKEEREAQLDQQFHGLGITLRR